jgi:hypothetical protein
MVFIPELVDVWNVGKLLVTDIKLADLEFNTDFSLPKNATSEEIHKKAKENYKILHKTAWNLMRTLYRATAYGPLEINGPAAVIVPDAHLASPDPWMFTYMETYLGMVYKKDTALNSKTARLVGGIEVRKEAATRVDFNRLDYLLDQGETVASFLFSDVLGAQPETLLIKRIMRYEWGHGKTEGHGPINYHAAKIIWEKKGIELTKLDNNHIFGEWPKPFLTRATSLVSDRPISSDELVEALKVETKRMYDEYTTK